MIEHKYGMKYPFPHSLVHIVDNSANDINPEPVVVGDPSLFSTMVVTAMPIGIDNRFVTVTRSDVLNTAFGARNITSSDISKYGQTITYPGSLINNGSAPVRLLRITPEDSEYAFSVILVQWSESVDENNCLKVRFLTVNEKPDDIDTSKWKNTERFYKALVSKYKSEVTENGEKWQQRLFVANIAAGRGSGYNGMYTVIDSTTQSKKPANITYRFATIDGKTNAVLEEFVASLINHEQTRIDYIDTVNTVVGRRLEGSSVIVNYVNESAIQEVYKAYIDNFDIQIQDQEIVDKTIIEVRKTLSVNTFDILFGKYIYNGSGTGVMLPFYSVDMKFADIPLLDSNYRYADAYAANYEPKPLYTRAGKKENIVGLNVDTDSVILGSIYVTKIGSSSFYPRMSMIAGINQSTGVVTTVTIPKIYGMKAATEPATGYVIDTDRSDKIKYITSEMPTSDDGLWYFKFTSSDSIPSLAKKGKLAPGDIVCVNNPTGNTFKLYQLTEKDDAFIDSEGKVYSIPYNGLVYDAIDWSSNNAAGNLIGYNTDAQAFWKKGYIWLKDVVDETAAAKYKSIRINTYNATATTSHGAPIDGSDATGTDGQEIFFVTKSGANDSKYYVFGEVPQTVNITKNLIGVSYDLELFDDNSGTAKFVAGSDLTVVNGGSEYVDSATYHLSTTGADGAPTSKAPLVLNIESGVIKSAKIGASTEDETIDIVDIVGMQVTTIAESTSGSTAPAGSGAKFVISDKNFKNVPKEIQRWIVAGTMGSLLRFAREQVDIPENYYSDSLGINPSSEAGGVPIQFGTTGFFDDTTIESWEFKYKYSALLVKAYRGQIDPAIYSPQRCPAKYLFDGATNTIVGQTILPYMNPTVDIVISASTIFDDDEKDFVIVNGYGDLQYADIDVKQAMYDLMIERCYHRIPEDKRPIGPGSGLSLHLDSGFADNQVINQMDISFNNRFDNPNCSWDIGGYVSSADGLKYTYTKKLVDGMIENCKRYTVNKPFTGKYSAIAQDEYISYFPDLDETDWELREKLYNFGGNTWIADSKGNLMRQSQRTLLRNSETSDIVQESNMRTLSQLCYLLQSKIDEYLLEYNDDGVIKTLSDEVNNMFSPWVGSLVQSLNIEFARDTNIDGGDIVVCTVNVTFRGLILRVPIIVNVNRRVS